MRQIIAVLVFVMGCAGEITGEPGSGSNGVDAPLGTGPDAANAGPDAAVGGGFTCRAPIALVGSGQHNPGQDCNGACHNHGFTLAGTAFAAATGATPFVGGTITIVDANNQTVDIPTLRNGNFYTTANLAFPVSVTASACPNVAPMNTKVAATSAGCNQSGCHGVGGGGQGQIHLP